MVFLLFGKTPTKRERQKFQIFWGEFELIFVLHRVDYPQPIGIGSTLVVTPSLTLSYANHYKHTLSLDLDIRAESVIQGNQVSIH